MLRPGGRMTPVGRSTKSYAAALTSSPGRVHPVVDHDSCIRRGSIPQPISRRSERMM